MRERLGIPSACFDCDHEYQVPLHLQYAFECKHGVFCAVETKQRLCFVKFFLRILLPSHLFPSSHNIIILFCTSSPQSIKDASTATPCQRGAARQRIPKLVLAGCRIGRYIVTISSPMPPSRILRSIRHLWRLIDLAVVAVVVDSMVLLLARYRRIISSTSLSSSIMP